jgi:hypothetical protein
MRFNDILDQAIEILQRRGRITYRTLKREFNLDDEALADLTFELIEGQRLAIDEHGTVLVWNGDAVHATTPVRQQPAPPITYTPRYLTELRAWQTRSRCVN